MSIKLGVIKTGEQIIAKVEEMILEDKVVGYFFIRPCIVNTSAPKIEESEDGESRGASFDIRLSPWIPLGKGTRFPVPLDWIVTFIDPVDELNQMYTRDILQETEDTQEQSIVLTDECEDC
tara:strand:- start:807 stop:1169 length:363 start_codon:yes stop_codon:yes gene_type:complete